ncbi:MAG: methylated-DNA--[protein]-cysteine S-methyltransferase [Methanothrix sp.]|nr:methylated-DNA--[protein]-cysteine S-methyltransferase [Methanothrix sp.]
MMQMASGAFLSFLGCSLLVQKRGEMVCRIYFAQESPAEPSPLAEDIAAYLEGKAPCPNVQLDMSGCTDFQKQIYALVQSIPRGTTATYGQVAERAKRPGAARAVGRAMAANPFAILVPCHRVVAKNGLGGYAWGREMKEKLLEMESGPCVKSSVSGWRQSTLHQKSASPLGASFFS